MTQYNVDAAHVSTAASQATRSSDAIRTEVAAMLSHLTSLEGSWQGGASAAFSGLLAQWRAAQLQVETALDSIGLALGQAAEQYTVAEENATRLFAR